MGENAAPVAGLTDPAEWLFAFVALVLLGGHLLFRGRSRHKRVRLLIALSFGQNRRAMLLLMMMTFASSLVSLAVKVRPSIKRPPTASK